ncbi:MAG: hypothetical protein R3E68_06920 [Burkholderiaceae bacterium]
MSTAPRFDIDVEAFTDDPYPALARMRAQAPIAYVPQLGATLFTRRADIVVCEKQVDVFSSEQPDGLMNRLMGRNMMRKDGREHLLERKAMFPAVSPQTVRGIWQAQFQAQADRLLDAIEPAGRADLVRDYALPLSGEALKAITGLHTATFAQIDAWSQAMIDGVANYGGDPALQARCLAATAAIDASIDDALAPGATGDGCSMLEVMRRADVPMDSVRADIKLAISGGQNEPRDAIAGAAWALLTHPGQAGRALAGDLSWGQVFDEYVRWISPIGMSPRRIARAHAIGPVRFEVDERIFFSCSGRRTATRPSSSRPGASIRIATPASTSRSGRVRIFAPGRPRRAP